MNHRIVSRVVTVIVALFLTTALVFAWVADIRAPERVTAPSAPDIPHPPEARDDDCRHCHVSARDSLPVTHRSFELDTCEACHRPSTRVQVPHRVSMGERKCPMCHGDPKRDHGMPERHLLYEPGQCLLCHPPDPRRVDTDPLPAGISSSPAPEITHPVKGLFADCPDCHQLTGGRRLPVSHLRLKVDTCRLCHQPAADS